MAPLKHFRRYIKHSLKLAGVLLNERLAGVAVASGLPLPPPRRRHRVHGAMDARSFLSVGSNCARDLAALTKKQGREFATFERVTSRYWHAWSQEWPRIRTQWCWPSP